MLNKDEAVRRAMEHVQKSRMVACEYGSAIEDAEPDPRTGEPRWGWVVMFDITESRMDPGQIWIFIDGETGAARGIPLL